jgi:hypothetical protein
MNVSIHLQADLHAVRDVLEPLLWPETSAVLVPRDGWISVYAEQLSDDFEDIAELAAPLEALNPVFIALPAVKQYRSDGLIETTQELPFEIADEFERFEQNMPLGAVRLERDASKPGMAEFFGRSTDE